MPTKLWMTVLGILFSLSLTARPCCAESNPGGLGQFIQITSQLDSFVGKPTWLLIIRDIEHGQTIPYLFEFTQENHGWIALSFSKKYLITVSELKISRYLPHQNRFVTKTIHNFCQLESNGRIQRGESLNVMLQGRLTLNPNTVTCDVTRFRDAPLTVTAPDEN